MSRLQQLDAGKTAALERRFRNWERHRTHHTTNTDDVDEDTVELQNGMESVRDIRANVARE